MKNIEFVKRKILLAQTFNGARDIFDENIDFFVTKQERLELVDTLQAKVETPNDVLLIADFYERLGAYQKLVKYIRNCEFSNYEKIKIKRISIEKRYGDISQGIAISDDMDMDDPQNFYVFNQKASMLNRKGDVIEARRIIQTLMKRRITKYEIHTYASIINNMFKNDDLARKFCIPSLAVDICKCEEVRPFDFKRLLKNIIKFETQIGNKEDAENTQKILTLYEKIIEKAQ